MFPYFWLLFISTVIPLIFCQSTRGVWVSGHSRVVLRRNKVTILLFFIGLFILLALRDISVGRDLIEYKKIFERCAVLSFDRLQKLQWELGYTIYNKVITLVSEEYRFFLIVTAALILMPIYKLYSKETKYSFLLIVLFINMPCFLMIFSGLRQALATSIGILAFLALENKKYLLSAPLILLAICFHTSAYVLLLLYPAFLFKLKTKHLLIVVPVMLLIYIYRIPLLKLMISLSPERYEEFYSDIQETGAIGMMVLFLLFSVFSFAMLDENAMTKRDFCLRNILLISTILQFFVPIHELVQRISYYFLIFVPIAIVSVVQAPKKWLKDISDMAVVAMCLFFVAYFFYNGAFSEDNLLDVFPYKFYWSAQTW